MRLEKLHLVNFKNYEEAHLDFRGNIHCFLGKNGSGKTNLLEAIHYLSFTKGSAPSDDASAIRHGQSEFQLNGEFEKNGKQWVIGCFFGTARKKTVSENGTEYARFSEHIGKYPLVWVAPNDIELIWNGGEIRRRFFDSLLSQVDRDYLANLIIYQAQLRQRNSLLKIFGERGSVDVDLLDSYDEKIVASGVYLFNKRKAFSNEYAPLLASRYAFLSGEAGEKAEALYESELSRVDFASELRNRVTRDVALGRSTIGVHRDDFNFLLNGFDLRRYGSQGQQKSFLIAMKLAEFDFLMNRKASKPLILLDDIFDKLDDDRIHQLMKLVTDGAFGQIFITDARPERTLEVLKEAKVKSQNFLVEEGRVSEIIR